MKTFQPQQPLLRPYVKQIHHFTLRPGNLSYRTSIPTGNVLLLIFLGNTDYIFQRPNAKEQAHAGSVYISGQQFEIVRHWINEGEINVIGFELTPDAIYQFFGIPQ